MYVQYLSVGVTVEPLGRLSIFGHSSKLTINMNLVLGCRLSAPETTKHYSIFCTLMLGKTCKATVR